MKNIQKSSSVQKIIEKKLIFTLKKILFVPFLKKVETTSLSISPPTGTIIIVFNFILSLK